jgi:pyruvate dehydrogenase E2 component (dihydrolipoamide acetyltransferase)
VDVTVPQLGETVAEATVTRWLKRVGEPVREGEPLFEVATDKVDTEVPAAAGGTLSEILVAEDQTVPVGTTIAVISAAERQSGPSAPASPAPAAPAGAVPANGNRGRVPRHHLLTPLVRRLLSENGLTPADVTGTGPQGKVTRQDVLAAAARKPAGEGNGAPPHAAADPPAAVPPAAAAVPGAAAPVPGAAPPAPPAPVPTAPAPRPVHEPEPVAPAPARPIPVSAALAEEATVVPFSTIRRRTAEHMVASKAISPHTLMAIEVDYSRVDSVRVPAAAAWKAAEGTGLTYLPFVARAVVDAIAAFPHINASVDGDRLLVHRRVNLGIAVDLDGDGLVVPVIRDADGKRLRAISREVADLARRARALKLTPDEFAAGTFTISNPGPYGTLITGAIISQPQVAILATDAVRPRPVAVPADGGYAVAVHPVGNLALNFDHRAIDGGYAARFLNKIKEILERRDWASEL